jgi:hypothetical protein
MSGDYSCIRCVTTWGAVLSVKAISRTVVRVSDPNAVDSGMFIGIDDIQTMWKVLLYSDCSHPQYSNKEWAKLKQHF